MSMEKSLTRKFLETRQALLKFDYIVKMKINIVHFVNLYSYLFSIAHTGLVFYM